MQITQTLKKNTNDLTVQLLYHYLYAMCLVGGYSSARHLSEPGLPLLR
jgi:hypothetical protein